MAMGAGYSKFNTKTNTCYDETGAAKYQWNRVVECGYVYDAARAPGSATRCLDSKLCIDLAGKNFSKRVLKALVIQFADLRNTNFSNSNLAFADLFMSDLSGANLSNADLRYANLKNITFSNNTNLQGAYLRGAEVCGVDLSKIPASNLKGSKWRGAIFDDFTVLPLDMTKQDAIQTTGMVYKPNCLNNPLFGISGN
ncbi:MAG: hypothetical protein A2583_06810 [Bdellovibrionales bacterium RIFOXYD1_FULL_53_11]|nr:MAG: hypothetical protein A2583_06810 [Bdellovibrionales bacterium RIFOXYD1_FULL_53_11]